MYTTLSLDAKPIESAQLWVLYQEPVVLGRNLEPTVGVLNKELQVSVPNVEPIVSVPNVEPIV